MKRREQLLTLIRSEVAEEGKITERALGFYAENRIIGYAAFQQAAREGMELHKRRAAKEQP